MLRTCKCRRCSLYQKPAHIFGLNHRSIYEKPIPTERRGKRGEGRLRDCRTTGRRTTDQSRNLERSEPDWRKAEIKISGRGRGRRRGRGGWGEGDDGGVEMHYSISAPNRRAFPGCRDRPESARRWRGRGVPNPAIPTQLSCHASPRHKTG